MRKRIIGSGSEPIAAVEPAEWFGLDRVALVEVSSEDPVHPIEAALDGHGRGWRAGSSGDQTVQLWFEEPQRVRRIAIEIDDDAVERTQEFSISYVYPDGEAHEILRQQWNFSPRGATHEAEDFRVDLPNVAMLRFLLRPDVANPQAFASITRLRIG